MPISISLIVGKVSQKADCLLVGVTGTIAAEQRRGIHAGSKDLAARRYPFIPIFIVIISIASCVDSGGFEVRPVRLRHSWPIQEFNVLLIGAWVFLL
jgi:hypothetical protein